MPNSLSAAQPPASSRRLSRTGRFGVLGAAAAVAAVAIGISGVEQPALADVTALNPLDPALNFNAFIEGDTVLAEHEMEGPLATGGTLAIQGIYEINTQRRLHRR